jgi:hypothetical protein
VKAHDVEYALIEGKTAFFAVFPVICSGSVAVAGIVAVFHAAGVVENGSGAKGFAVILRKFHFFCNEEGKEKDAGAMFFSVYLAALHKEAHVVMKKLAPAGIIGCDGRRNIHGISSFLTYYKAGNGSLRNSFPALSYMAFLISPSTSAILPSMP